MFFFLYFYFSVCSCPKICVRTSVIWQAKKKKKRKTAWESDSLLRSFVPMREICGGRREKGNCWLKEGRSHRSFTFPLAKNIIKLQSGLMTFR